MGGGGNYVLSAKSVLLVHAFCITVMIIQITSPCYSFIDRASLRPNSSNDYHWHAKYLQTDWLSSLFGWKLWTSEDDQPTFGTAQYGRLIGYTWTPRRNWGWVPFFIRIHFLVRRHNPEKKKCLSRSWASLYKTIV